MTVRKTLCRIEDIPDGGATAVRVEADDGAYSLILLRRGGRVFGYRNECPHTGGRLDWSPGQFLFEDERLVCAAHGACFVVESGYCLAGPPRGSSLPRVAVEVVDGDVRFA